MAVMVLADGFTDPEQGPGKLIGLLIGAVICFLIFRFEERFTKRFITRDAPDKKDPASGAVRPAAPVPAKVPRARHASVDDLPPPWQPERVPERVSAPSVPWYGRITRMADGTYRRVKHVVTTGESLPVDVELVDDEGYDVDDVEAYEPPPAGRVGRGDADGPELPPFLDDPFGDDEEPDVAIAATEVMQREDAESYASRCLRQGYEKAMIVEGLEEHYRVSRATAYRVLQRLSDSRAA